MWIFVIIAWLLITSRFIHRVIIGGMHFYNNFNYVYNIFAHQGYPKQLGGVIDTTFQPGN